MLERQALLPAEPSSQSLFDLIYLNLEVSIERTVNEAEGRDFPEKSL